MNKDDQHGWTNWWLFLIWVQLTLMGLFLTDIVRAVRVLAGL